MGWDDATVNHYLCHRRDWTAVHNFYADIMIGNIKLQDIGISDAPCPAEPRAGVASPAVEGQPGGGPKWRIFLAYQGQEGTSWDAAPAGEMPLRQSVIKAVTGLIPEGEKKTDPEVALNSETGASANAQIISFKAFTDHAPVVLEVIINKQLPLYMYAYGAERVPQAFCAHKKIRLLRFMYLLPLHGAVSRLPQSNNDPPQDPPTLAQCDQSNRALDVDPERVQRLLDAVCNKPLNFAGFRRENVGQRYINECYSTIKRATARRVTVRNTPAMCLEFSCERIYRHMVRVLISTAVRESIPGAGWFSKQGDNALLTIINAAEQSFTCPAAPVDGLCFIGAEYDEGSAVQPEVQSDSKPAASSEQGLGMGLEDAQCYIHACSI